MSNVPAERESERTLESAVKLIKGKRYDQALRELKVLSDDPSDNPELSYYIGICYAKLKEYDNALLYLEQAVSHHWNVILSYQCRMILAYIYAVTGRHQLAVYELRQLETIGYESVQTHATFAFVLFEQGESGKALEHLNRALELDPDNPNALNSTGYIMAEEGIDIQRAINYCKAALRHNPDNPAYLDSMGWSLYKAGKYDEAKQYLKKALTLASGNSTIATHMRILLDTTGSAG